MNSVSETDARWVISGRIAIGLIAVAVIVLVIATIRSGDPLGRLWLLTFAIAGTVVAGGWIAFRAYRRRGRTRSAVLHRRFAGAVIVASVVTPAFRRDATVVARILGTNVGSLMLGASLSLVVGTDGMTVFTGSREPVAVLSIPSPVIESTARSVAFGVDGTPVPGVQFAIVQGDQRVVLNAYVRPAVARLAVQRMQELLG